MDHYFSPEVAQKVGVHAAVIFKHLNNQINRLAAIDKNFYDGKTWTPNTFEELHEQLPYLSVDQINREVQKLKKGGWIEVRQFCKSKFDSTNFYAVGDCIENARLKLSQSPAGEQLSGSDFDRLKTAINKLFHRKEATLWTAKETELLYRTARRPGVLDEMDEITELYNSGYKYRRLDVFSFLYNFTGELDRARLMSGKKKTKRSAR